MAYFAITPLLCFLILFPLEGSALESEIEINLYIRQAWSTSNNNQVVVVGTTGAGNFGTTAVGDWSVHDGPDPSATLVGHMRGLHTKVSQTKFIWYLTASLMFEDASRFNGSTIEVIGTQPAAEQWSIVGGTGEFSMARGIVKIIKYTDLGGVRTFEVKVHAYYTRMVDTKVSDNYVHESQISALLPDI